MTTTTVTRSSDAGVRVNDLSHSFDDHGQDRLVLDDINLSIVPGEFCCLIGPSGCGKTTLIRLIHGLLEPQHGGVDVDGAPARTMATPRGFVFQQDALFPWRNVAQNIQFPLEIAGVDRAARRARVQDLIGLINLAGFERHYPHQLSGGMRQRVNLARALATDPSLLIMDEPFAALDALTREQMQQELIRVWEATKKTVVFVTHQIEEAVLLGDVVHVMTPHPGRLGRSHRIDLDRPRTEATRGSDRFAAYVDELRADVQSSVSTPRPAVQAS